MAFQPGQSGNPSGRPRGSRNRTTSALRALIDEEGAEMVRVLATAARNGNVNAAKALLDRILPPVRSGFGEIDIPSASDLPLTAAADAVIQAVSDGALAPAEALQIGTLLKIRAELRGLAELEQRLAKLETELKEHK